MTGFIAGLVTMATFVAVLLMVIRFVKSPETKEQKEEEKDIDVSDMDVEEREDILKQYSGKRNPFRFTEHIKGEIKDLSVQFVTVHGTRYETMEQALEESTLIKKQTRRDMKQFMAELAFLRQERERSTRYYRVEKTAFDGEIYVYQPCKIKIDTTTSLRLKKPARIGVEVVKREDGSMDISKIFVSKLDVSNDSNRYVFNMDNEKEQISFSLLVGNSDIYKEEMFEVEKLIKRLDKYNQIVEEKRIHVGADGRITISPPTPTQLENRPKEDNDEEKTIEEVEEEAKEQVDEEFISSIDAI